MGILMNNFYKDTIICKNNFFNNPDKVLSLFDKQEFKQFNSCPGRRSNNLLESTDNDTRNFALFFAQKICNEVFLGVHKAIIDIRFHVHVSYNNELANNGWIHSDDANLAGVVYLTKNESSFDTGTSIFLKKLNDDFKADDFSSRQEFNISKIVTEEYLNDLKNNHNTFAETIRIGNIYNRLLAYDARMYHRPNRYNLECDDVRKSIVFFIRNFEYDPVSRINLNFSWED